MKFADYACACIVLVAGMAGIVYIEIQHPQQAVLDTPLLWILVGMFNLLRLRNGSSVRGLRIFCFGANVATLVLEVNRLKMLRNTDLGLVIALSIAAETLFSILPLSIERVQQIAFDGRFWSGVASAYAFPAAMFALAIIPGCNFTYSGHGGISWAVAPLCFPYIILRALIKTMKGTPESRRWNKGFFKATIPAYIALALPLSWAAATSIRHTFGLPVSPWGFFAVMVSPLPWYYFT